MNTAKLNTYNDISPYVILIILFRFLGTITNIILNVNIGFIQSRKRDCDISNFLKWSRDGEVLIKHVIYSNA